MENTQYARVGTVRKKVIVDTNTLSQTEYTGATVFFKMAEEAKRITNPLNNTSCK